MALLANSLIADTVLIVSGLLLLVWLYFLYKLSYWQRRGVPHLKPTPPFGNFKDCVLQKENVGQFMQRMYNEGASKPFVGCYIFTRCLLPSWDSVMELGSLLNYCNWKGSWPNLCGSAENLASPVPPTCPPPLSLCHVSAHWT
jgi:hypothetical protein